MRRNTRAVILLIVLAAFTAYLAVGLGFHLKWSAALAQCNAVLREEGEFVEPEIFDTGVGLVFNVTFWPIYVMANTYHDGTPFATPCTH